MNFMSTEDCDRTIVYNSISKSEGRYPLVGRG